MINLESRDWSLEAGTLGNAGPLIPTPLARRVSSTFSVRAGLRNSCENRRAEEAAVARAQVPTPGTAPWGERGVGGPSVSQEGGQGRGWTASGGGQVTSGTAGRRDGEGAPRLSPMLGALGFGPALASLQGVPGPGKWPPGHARARRRALWNARGGCGGHVRVRAEVGNW